MTRKKINKIRSQKINNNIYFKSIIRIVSVFLILGMNWAGIVAVGVTVAAFNDTETSLDNTMVAGSLDFVLDVNPFNDMEAVVNMRPDVSAGRNVDISPEFDSNPFQYYASSTNFIGDTDFCNSLNVTATRNGVAVYIGALTSLITTETTLLDGWRFEIGTDIESVNKVCDFDISFNGWQTRHNYSSYEEGGFNDVEVFHSRIASGGLRINKVYHDVLSLGEFAGDRGVERDNEWIEIYNQTSVPVDISGWELCDNTQCHIVPVSDTIPAHGFAVISPSFTTWDYWKVPEDFVVIEMPLGNGLANSADMLLLKRPDGVVVDQMNWGTVGSWSTDNGELWSPGVSSASDGVLLSRKPTGYDTDQVSDWVELSAPEVDLLYPDEGMTYIWYWGYEYPIEWIATNPNGPDKDLTIELNYILDIGGEQGDGKVGEDDIWKTVVCNEAIEDNICKWTVPAGFIGYIWIELTATGPENPMLNSTTISGDIWDPIPVYIADPREGEVSLEEVLAEEIVEPIVEIEPVVEEDALPEVLEPEPEQEVLGEPESEVVPEEVPETPTEVELAPENELAPEEEPLVDPIEEEVVPEPIVEEPVEEPVIEALEEETPAEEEVEEVLPLPVEEPAVEEPVIEEAVDVPEEVVEEDIPEEEALPEESVPAEEEVDIPEEPELLTEPVSLPESEVQPEEELSPEDTLPEIPVID